MTQSKTLAVRIYEHGGPNVLRAEECAVGMPAAGEVRIAQSAIGLNFVDTYHRSGLYPVSMPGIIGMEGAGIVTDVGEGVKNFKQGERVAYASAPLGAYAAVRTMPADRVIKLPDFLTERDAAAFMVKGMTAEFLVRRCYPVKTGDVVLIHAAAGGVGTILCQWAAHLGATVIATAGSDEKCTIAKENGAAIAINYKKDDFVQAVKSCTGGKGVHTVYDGVGAATFMGSLDCLRARGMMVSYGNASGPVPDFPPRLLASKGSLFLTRPSLWHYTMTTEEYQGSAAALFDVLEKGIVRIQPSKAYALADAANAHRDLEDRRITGSAVLLP
jgi:NADPH2:quinone reductase